MRPKKGIPDEPGGRRHLLLHGDGIRGNLSIPYYGVDRAVREWAQTIGAAADYVHLGHFHRSAQIQTPPGQVPVSGSWVGAKPYALRQFREAILPRQNLYLFDRSGPACTYTLRLSERPVLVPDGRGVYAAAPAPEGGREAARGENGALVKRMEASAVALESEQGALRRAMERFAERRLPHLLGIVRPVRAGAGSARPRPPR